MGLDIGVSTVKAVCLRFIKDAPELVHFALEPVQLDLSETLKKITTACRKKAVNVSVSGTQAVIRYVNFPKMNEEELKQALKFEAQKHIPFPLAETYLDHYILKQDLPNNKMLVLLAAVKKELVAQRLKVIEEAGVKVNIVDVDSPALVNAFNFNYSSDQTLGHKAVALLNIGAAITNLDILEDFCPRLSRDINIAGNSFTQKLVDIFGLDFQGAENLKLNPDKERANKVFAAAESVLTNLADEVRTSFDYYESQNASTIAKIFLSGGSSRFPGLKDKLANFLGIEIDFWDPFRNISLSKDVDAQGLKDASGQLPVALGLALRQ